MATYVYTHCGMTKEVVQSIKDKLVIPKCSICNDDMTRQYNTFGLSFKGSGFYANDKRA